MCVYVHTRTRGCVSARARACACVCNTVKVESLALLNFKEIIFTKYTLTNLSKTVILGQHSDKFYFDKFIPTHQIHQSFYLTVVCVAM